MDFEMKELIEKFIKEYGSNPNNWNWNYISKYQKLSEEFIEKFKDNLNWNNLIKNPNCPPKVRIKYMRETGMIMKEDPNKHDIEWIDDEPKKPNKDLEELRKLVRENSTVTS